MTCRFTKLGPNASKVVCTEDPEARWIASMVEQNECEQRIYMLENDLKWEEDNGLHDYETDVDYVPVEFLPVMNGGG